MTQEARRLAATGPVSQSWRKIGHHCPVTRCCHARYQILGTDVRFQSLEEIIKADEKAHKALANSGESYNPLRSLTWRKLAARQL